MHKNETDLIKCSKSRLLTAKGYKFMNDIIRIFCDSKGLHRLQLKEEVAKIQDLIYVLILDKKLSKNEIIQRIKENKFKLLKE